MLTNNIADIYDVEGDTVYGDLKKRFVSPKPSTLEVHIIFGVTGQIGSYLAELILNKGHKVIGITRRVSNDNTQRLSECLPHKNFSLMMADVTDPFSLSKVFNEIIVDKNVKYIIYNLAAMSHVHVSFNQPILSGQITGLGHLNILETLLPIHRHGYNIKTFFMASSEMFGSNIGVGSVQDFTTPFSPNSPYSAAKLYAYHMNRIYRESYGMFNTAGIIFNTESPRRGKEFVTRKITSWFANFAYNYNTDNLFVPLRLGNVNSCRDWTHALDTVEAIYLIANNQLPKDYVVASGETHSISNFLQECYNCMEEYCGFTCKWDLDYLWETDKNFYRPNEVQYLKGNSCKLREELGWKPKISFKELIYDMFTHDYKQLIKKEELCKN